MNKFVKKLMALGLVTVVVTGCSTNSVETSTNSSNTESTTVTETKTETTETSETATEDPVAELPFPEYRNEKGEIDLKGETVKVLWNVKEDAPWIKYFEETYNGKVEIEFADWGDVVNKLSASVASGDPADIVYVYASWYPSHITAGLLEPVDQYMELAKSLQKEDDLHYFSEEEMEYFKWRGQNYVYAQEDAQVDMGIFYNTAMLDEMGLEYPYELEKKGEWTWEKMAEYAAALTVDKDGDGTVDQYGIEPSSLFDMFLASNDTDLIKLPREEGDPSASLTFDDPKTMNALNAYEKLMLSGNLGGNFPEGTAAMGYRASSDVKNHKFNEKFTVDGWGFCGTPAGPDNTSGKYGSTHTSGWGIVKGSKNPVAATVALHCMINRPYEKQPDEVPFLGFKDQQDLDRIKEYAKNSNKTLYHMVEGAGFANEMGKKPLATLIEELKPEIQKLLDEKVRDK